MKIPSIIGLITAPLVVTGGVVLTKMEKNEFPPISSEESKQHEANLDSFLSSTSFEEKCKTKIKEFSKESLFEGISKDNKTFSFRKEESANVRPILEDCSNIYVTYESRKKTIKNGEQETKKQETKYTIFKEKTN